MLNNSSMSDLISTTNPKSAPVADCFLDIVWVPLPTCFWFCRRTSSAGNPSFTWCLTVCLVTKGLLHSLPFPPCLLSLYLFSFHGTSSSLSIPTCWELPLLCMLTCSLADRRALACGHNTSMHFLTLLESQHPEGPLPFH